MNKGIMKRVLREADYIIITRCTIRQAAYKFGVGKSTVHKDIVHRLKGIDLLRYREVRKVLEYNIRERSIRGGESTKRIYELRKRSKIASSINDNAS